MTDGYGKSLFNEIFRKHEQKQSKQNNIKSSMFACHSTRLLAAGSTWNTATLPVRGHGCPEHGRLALRISLWNCVIVGLSASWILLPLLLGPFSLPDFGSSWFPGHGNKLWWTFGSMSNKFLWLLLHLYRGFEAPVELTIVNSNIFCNKASVDYFTV